MQWRVEIPKAVRESEIVIVCLSQGSIGKTGFIQKEIKYALDIALEQPADTIFLVPLRLEECDVPESLGAWQWVNFFEDNGYERLKMALRSRAHALGLSAQASTETTDSSRDSAREGPNEHPPGHRDSVHR